LFKTIPQEFIDKIYFINGSLLDKQCLHLENAIKFCNDIKFLEDYEGRLDESLERRREVFHLWEETYNLNSYV
jgi:hypothetical protein